MSAQIIDGKKIAADIRNEVKDQARMLRSERGIVPGLAFILVGDHPSSQSYVRMKGKACEELGFFSVTEKLPESIPEKELLNLIERFNRDNRIHGILVQLPLPENFNPGKILSVIDYRKDVDGFHPVNTGRLVAGLPCFKPCTPYGIQELLLRSGNDPAGKHVVIIGRSNIVGKPLANILLQKQPGANAIVTVAHTGAGNLNPYSKSADILVVAIGRPESVTGRMIRKGAVVIDVGINRIPDQDAPNGYRIVGDVHFPSASSVASAITPVPGGVGPMTIAMLMRNTLDAARGLPF